MGALMVKVDGVMVPVYGVAEEPAPGDVYGLAAGSLGALGGTIAGTVTTPGGIIYLSLPGTTGSYASVPDTAALDLAGSHSMLFRLRLPDWTPSTQRVICAKWGSTGNFSYYWQQQTNGSWYFQFTNNGTAIGSGTTSVPSAVPDPDTWAWIRLKYVIGTQTITFDTAPDNASTPVSWTNRATGTTSSGSSFYAGTAAYSIGSIASGDYRNMQMDIAQHIILNSSDVSIFTLDPDNYVSGSGTTWVTDSGHTVTMAGSAAVL
jgi:hypothetical protein